MELGSLSYDEFNCGRGRMIVAMIVCLSQITDCCCKMKLHPVSDSSWQMQCARACAAAALRGLLLLGCTFWCTELSFAWFHIQSEANDKSALFASGVLQVGLAR
jgi:hypothetical protein